MPYIADVLVVAAVDITAGAVLAKGAGGNVAQAQEAAFALVLADDGLAALARLGLAAVVGGGGSDGSGHKGESSENELHCD